MDRIELRGGAPLAGEVEISGAKNAALPILFSTLVSSGVHTLHRIPRLRDVATTIHLLENLGVVVTRENEHVLTVDTTNVNRHIADYDLVRTMRASILVLGALMARFGKARVSLPGGCAIGARPVDLHLAGLTEMGVKIDLNQGYIDASAEKMTGADIHLRFPTLTGTENLMMAAVRARGRTRIFNAACDPEVADLADALRKMGAAIEGAGTPAITIEGVSRPFKAIEHTIIPDRIEAGTFIAAAGITSGDLKLTNCNPKHLSALLEKMRTIGLSITEGDDWIQVSANADDLRSANIETAPFPGFPTDLQAQASALLATIPGTSVVMESIFENRFMHVAELNRMGARIEIHGNRAFIHGGAKLQGAPVMATDLRASVALILAGLAASGTTIVDRVYHLDRGYEKIEEKLSALGAQLRRIPGKSPTFK